MLPACGRCGYNLFWRWVIREALENVEREQILEIIEARVDPLPVADRAS